MDLPPITVDDARAASAAQPSRQRTYAFRLRDPDGDLAGNATTTVDADETEDPDVLVAGINVLPAHRGRGLGTRLRAELVALARSLDKPYLVGDTDEGIGSGAAFAVAVGARPLDPPAHPGPFIERTWELPVETAAAWLRQRGVEAPG